MKLSLALLAVAFAASEDDKLLGDYVDMMMRQASGESDVAGTDLDEAIQAKHGHGPHGHNPHRHWPHRHNPHRHTPYPTPFPTPHPCDNGSHGCEKRSQGICYKQGGNRWTCGCRGGYYCQRGCSQPHRGHTCTRITASPTPFPTPFPTPYPTAMPTPAPTAAPTARCPVTCEVDNGQFAGKKIYGHPNFASLNQFHGVNSEERNCHKHNTVSDRTADKCNFDNKKANRVVTTHNIEVINEHDSYNKHRCYVYNNKCICECLDFADFFQEGTKQGKAAGKSDHKGAISTSIDTVSTLKAAGKFWKAPSYFISTNEVTAIRQCCAEEFAVNPEFILPAHSCAEVQTATDAQILASLTNLEEGGAVTNTKVISWLHEQGCSKHDKIHQSFEGKQEAHNGQQVNLKQQTVDGTVHGDKNDYTCQGIKKLAGTFTYFNTGTATGCEHRHHYLYDYHGSDCMWTSDKQIINYPHGYESMFARFMMAEYGNLENNDELKIMLRTCHEGNINNCSNWYNTIRLKDDVMGWRWTSVSGGADEAFINGNKNWKNTPVAIKTTDKYIQIRVMLKSSQNFYERHILDNLAIYGVCQG